MERSKPSLTVEDIPAEDKTKGYRLKQCIGKGGFGLVYNGDKIVRAKCAFKVLKYKVTKEDITEISVVQEIDHPNVNKY